MEDALIADGVIVKNNCVIEAGSRLDKNVIVKEGVILAKQTLASCRMIQGSGIHLDFPLITEALAEDSHFEAGAIIEETPEEMRLAPH